jgi:signal transduction histidine kinase
VSAHEFHTFNRCLDNAIADAVTEFARQREEKTAASGDLATSERLGSLAHELRNYLNTAMLALSAIKSGGVGLAGATSAVLDRSLLGLRGLIDSTLADVRLEAGQPGQTCDIAVDRFVAEVEVAAALDAKSRRCGLTVAPVDSALKIRGDKQMLYSALSNLLQNAFKFTRPGGQVGLRVDATADRVLIHVADACGGLPPGKEHSMFAAPFKQHHADRNGLGLGLSIARRAVEGSGGELRVRDVPGTGCVFTIDLPRPA